MDRDRDSLESVAKGRKRGRFIDLRCFQYDDKLQLKNLLLMINRRIFHTKTPNVPKNVTGEDFVSFLSSTFGANRTQTQIGAIELPLPAGNTPLAVCDTTCGRWKPKELKNPSLPRWWFWTWSEPGAAARHPRTTTPRSLYGSF